MPLLITTLIGLVFGVGISLSGMANPAKVINFFDVAGHWDPSLAFVMGGAVMVTAAGYRWVLKAPLPVFESKFFLPDATQIDRRLVAGAATFGVGWGLAGFCPGGALPALGTGVPQVYVFVIAMIAGMMGAKFLSNLLVDKLIKSSSIVKQT